MKSLLRRQRIVRYPSEDAAGSLFSIHATLISFASSPPISFSSCNRRMKSATVTFFDSSVFSKTRMSLSIASALREARGTCRLGSNAGLPSALLVWDMFSSKIKSLPQPEGFPTLSINSLSDLSLSSGLGSTGSSSAKLLKKSGRKKTSRRDSAPGRSDIGSSPGSKLLNQRKLLITEDGNKWLGTIKGLLGRVVHDGLAWTCDWLFAKVCKP
jgi:hypothetical protein